MTDAPRFVNRLYSVWLDGREYWFTVRVAVRPDGSLDFETKESPPPPPRLPPHRNGIPCEDCDARGCTMNCGPSSGTSTTSPPVSTKPARKKRV